MTRPCKKSHAPANRETTTRPRASSTPVARATLSRTVVRCFTNALHNLTTDERPDAEQAARLAFSRAVTHPDVMAAGAGIASADEQEAAKREGARIGWDDVTGTAYPITSAPVTHGRGRPAHDVAPEQVTLREVHGFV